MECYWERIAVFFFFYKKSIIGIGFKSIIDIWFKSIIGNWFQSIIENWFKIIIGILFQSIIEFLKIWSPIRDVFPVIL